MGLTSQSTGTGALTQELILKRSNPNERVIALAGNPNVGKSTVFNNLTGLNQHTGNWPGKTVTNAQGSYQHQDDHFILVDIPGTYSLMSNSEEETIARDFICFGNPDATVIVTDATCLERNLNLVLQTLEITSNVVVCVNLLDEAKRKKIEINVKELSEQLGVPVVGTSARSKKGLDTLMDAVYDLANGSVITSPKQIEYGEVIEEAIHILEPSIKELIKDKLNSRWVALKLLDGDEVLIDAIKKYLNFDIIQDASIAGKLMEAKERLDESKINQDLLRDKIVSRIIKSAEVIGSSCITYQDDKYNHTDRRIDRILTSRIFGIPIMISLLGIILWLTITGANYPSDKLSDVLFWIEDELTILCTWIGAPAWVHGLFVMGIYRTLAWVVSVMLPPMAIFFPLFTLLEDLGYLPRVAFNLDKFFQKACAHGKQSLTM